MKLQSVNIWFIYGNRATSVPSISKTRTISGSTIPWFLSLSSTSLSIESETKTLLDEYQKWLRSSQAINATRLCSLPTSRLSMLQTQSHSKLFCVGVISCVERRCLRRDRGNRNCGKNKLIKMFIWNCLAHSFVVWKIDCYKSDVVNEFSTWTVSGQQFFIYFNYSFDWIWWVWMWMCVCDVRVSECLFW